jgi:signal peptidase II
MVSLSFLLGGALGNFIDRVLFQQVVDFVDTFPFGHNFPIFNVADMALTFGVILMGIDALLESTGQNGNK